MSEEDNVLTEDCRKRMRNALASISDNIFDYKSRMDDGEFENAEDELSNLVNGVSVLMGVTNICEAQSSHRIKNRSNITPGQYF